MTNLGLWTYYFSQGLEKFSEKYIGQKIVSAEIIDEKLVLDFENGTGINIFDSAQYCCEQRYMKTDDDVSELIGHKLHHIEEKEDPTEDIGCVGYGNPQETCFIKVGTDVRFITITNYNEHNGYYGGFALAIAEI